LFLSNDNKKDQIVSSSDHYLASSTSLTILLLHPPYTQ